MSGKFKASIVFLILCTALLVVSLAALPPGQTSESAASTNTANLTTPDSATLVQDSVYAEINNGFVTLRPIFVKGCFDCHTHQTRFPWYYKLPIIKGMIDSDIRNAHKKLDMEPGFPFSKRGDVADDLVNIHDELQSSDMPPLSYRFMHWDAKPSKAERDSVFNWINRSLKSLSDIGIEPTAPPEGGDN